MPGSPHALARAVEDVTHGNGSLLVMGSSDEDPERERKLTLTFCARWADGHIAAELLFRRLSGEQGPAQRIEPPARLVIRGPGEIPPPGGPRIRP